MNSIGWLKVVLVVMRIFASRSVSFLSMKGPLNMLRSLRSEEGSTGSTLNLREGDNRWRCLRSCCECRALLCAPRDLDTLFEIMGDIQASSTSTGKRSKRAKADTYNATRFFPLLLPSRGRRAPGSPPRRTLSRAACSIHNSRRSCRSEQDLAPPSPDDTASYTEPLEEEKCTPHRQPSCRS